MRHDFPLEIREAHWTVRTYSTQRRDFAPHRRQKQQSNSV